VALGVHQHLDPAVPAATAVRVRPHRQREQLAAARPRTLVLDLGRASASSSAIGVAPTSAAGLAVAAELAGVEGTAIAELDALPTAAGPPRRHRRECQALGVVAGRPE
jgi:hypothetical protein